MRLIAVTQHWFFQEIDVRQYAMLRIGVGILIFIYLYQLLPSLTLHFTEDGWLGESWRVNQGTKSAWSLLYYLRSEPQVISFWILAMLFMAGFIIGFYTRFCGMMTWIALVSIWHRNPLMLDGDDAILRMAMFYLVFSACGKAFSVDARGLASPVMAPIWPLRMIQLQLVIVYFVSGWFKFQNPHWMDGSVLQFVLMNPQYSQWNFSSLIKQPWLKEIIAFLSFFICWWEMLFPLLMCQRHSRKICIIIGLTFHLGLLVMMHLRFFPVIMLVLYIAFLPNSLFGKTH